jgi:hypothetical protein
VEKRRIHRESGRIHMLHRGKQEQDLEGKGDVNLLKIRWGRVW